MQNPVIKMAILLGTLVMIFVGFTPRALSPGASSPGNGLLILQTNYALASSAGESEKARTVAQPLGTLTTIAWNNLEAAARRPELLNKLLIPSSDELWSKNTITTGAVNPFANDSPGSYQLPLKNDPVRTLYQQRDTNLQTMDYCFACHTSPSAFYQATATINNGSTLELMSYSWLGVSCIECHPLQPERISWQSRGVE